MSFFKTAVFYLIVFISLLGTHSVNAQFSTSHKIEYIADTTVNFENLLNKFKGRIIYIDIWATWCAPCRQELQQKKDIKEFGEYAVRNDVVILYICVDKASYNWKQFIAANRLTGYHILVNQSINETFHTTLSTIQKRKGIMKKSFYIPRHLIIDQTGAVVDSAADHQGSVSVYSKINKLLPSF